MSAPADKTLVQTPVRRVLVVLGMHRSGTSAVAGCLQRLGVDFGPRLMPPTKDNVRGFYEHIDVVNLHDRLLLALGGSWDEIRSLPDAWWELTPLVEPYRAEMLGLLNRDFPAAPVWGLKDPRLCLLLPWWGPLWTAANSRPLFIIVRRPPMEVAASLTQREGFSSAKSQLLWLQHVIAAERDTRGQQRVFVDFQDFLADWRRALNPVRVALNQPWPSGLAPDSTADPFVDSALSRSSGVTDVSTLSPWLAQAEAALQMGVAGRENEMRAALDALAANLRVAESLYAPPAEAAAADLRHQLEMARQQARWFEEEWQKSKGRVVKAEERSQVHQRKAEELHSHLLKKESELSNIRNKNISNMRKRRFSWVSKLTKRPPVP